MRWRYLPRNERRRRQCAPHNWGCNPTDADPLFVPLCGDKGPRFDGGFDNRAGVRAVVGVDIQNHVAAGLGLYRSNVRNSFFAIPFRDQRDIVRSNRFRESLTALVPRGMIRV